MKLHRFLAPVLAATAALAGVAAGGCAGEAYVLETAPPPPRTEVVVDRPGYIYVQGHWLRDAGSWSWRPGYYMRERPRHVYVQPRWERRGRSYVWVDGGWRPRGRVVGRGR